MRSLLYDADPARSIGLLLPAVAIAMACLAPLAVAQDTVHIAAPAGGESLVDAEPQPPSNIAAAIPPDSLESYRGGSNVSSNSVSNGMLQDTTAVNVATGVNAITDGAFAHASGLPVVIQNSGANVLIQNSTIVNVQFK